MAREFRIGFDRISDPQTITQENIKAFKEQDLDIHRHEVEKLEDDHGKRERVYRVKITKYFDMGSKNAR